MLFEGCDFLGRQCAVEYVNLRRTDQRTLRLGDDLDTLRGGIGPLIVLAGEVFHGKDQTAFRVEAPGRVVYLRFGEDRADRLCKEVLGDVFGIIAIDDANVFQMLETEEGNCLSQERSCLLSVFGFLFYVNAINHRQFSFQAKALAPMSRRYQAPSKEILPAIS